MITILFFFRNKTHEKKTPKKGHRTGGIRDLPTRQGVAARVDEVWHSTV